MHHIYKYSRVLQVDHTGKIIFVYTAQSYVYSGYLYIRLFPKIPFSFHIIRVVSLFAKILQLLQLNLIH